MRAHVCHGMKNHLKSNRSGEIPLSAHPPLSLDQFIRQSGLSAPTCWRYRKKGGVKSVIIGGRHFISREAIAEAKLELTQMGHVPTNAHRSLDGSDPTMPRFEAKAAEGTPEFTQVNCDKSNSW